MKIGNRRRNQNPNAGLSAKPSKNQSKKSLPIIITVIVTALLITWVYSMGRKAEETVQVCMTSQNIYKNQVITESMLQPYDMLKGEFEKFSTVTSSGTKQRRILLWDERSMIINSFAAYPLQANNYCEYRNFIKSRVDNKDNVLYSFPGKEIINLDIGVDDLSAFKTFLQPGDRVNITAMYSQLETVITDDGRMVWVIDAYTAQPFEEFLKGYELPVFSTDYISAWIEEIDERTYEIAILDTVSPKQTEPERYTFRLPKAYFGVCPF